MPMHRNKIWYQILCSDNVCRNKAYYDKQEANIVCASYNLKDEGCGRGTLAKDGIFGEGEKFDKGTCPGGIHYVRKRITRLYTKKG